MPESPLLLRGGCSAPPPDALQQSAAPRSPQLRGRTAALVASCHLGFLPEDDAAGDRLSCGDGCEQTAVAARHQPAGLASTPLLTERCTAEWPAQHADTRLAGACAGPSATLPADLAVQIPVATARAWQLKPDSVTACAVTVAGGPRVGTTITCHRDGHGVFGRQWHRVLTALQSAPGDMLHLQAAALGPPLRLRISTTSAAPAPNHNQRHHHLHHKQTAGQGQHPRQPCTLTFTASITTEHPEQAWLPLPEDVMRSLQLAGGAHTPCTLVLPGGRHVATAIVPHPDGGRISCSWQEAAAALQLQRGDLLQLQVSAARGRAVEMRLSSTRSTVHLLPRPAELRQPGLAFHANIRSAHVNTPIQRLNLPIAAVRGLRLAFEGCNECTLVLPDGRRIATTITSRAKPPSSFAAVFSSSWRGAAAALGLRAGDLLQMWAPLPLHPPLQLHLSVRRSLPPSQQPQKRQEQDADGPTGAPASAVPAKDLAWPPAESRGTALPVIAPSPLGPPRGSWRPAAAGTRARRIVARLRVPPVAPAGCFAAATSPAPPPPIPSANPQAASGEWPVYMQPLPGGSLGPSTFLRPVSCSY